MRIYEANYSDIDDQVSQLLWDAFKIDIDDLGDAATEPVNNIINSIEKLQAMNSKAFKVGDIVEMTNIDYLSSSFYKEKLVKIENGMYYFEDVDYDGGLVSSASDLDEDNILSSEGLTSWEEVEDSGVRSDEQFIQWCKENLKNFTSDDARRYKYFWDDELYGIFADELDYFETRKV